MLERIQDAPAQTLALKASGTIMARDVEAAIEAALGPSSAATGLVVVIDRDFDGYLAELARGLANAALAHRSLVKLAVVTDADRMDEARLSGFEHVGRADPALRDGGSEFGARLGGRSAPGRIGAAVGR